ncbi:tripartite tricarboxylate transporter substrate-binding protein [Roseomonas sp. E05]|nr:tripartite tricarboxylate transporter substrate-binding protein [Roseomonas sp. E05]MDJ0387803.1 tripartite tricarboxylate transporter substrate-binding protein [Roseomonas sp. E05]
MQRLRRARQAFRLGEATKVQSWSRSTGMAALPAYRSSAGYGVLAPKGTPAEIRSRLERAIADCLTDHAVVKRLHEEGAEPSRLGGTRFGGFMAEERTRWARLVREAGISVE